MRKPFDGDYKITQIFGVNPQDYIQFKLKGHNGVDYALPTGTHVLAPHAGKIIEATLDASGYGLYIKIENDIEGSVLAHLKEFRVGVGDTVTEGQLLGFSNNSGNSTGPHLHSGYYRFPRDRSNGYNGFIDQIPYLTNNLDPLQSCLEQHTKLVTECEFLKKQLTEKDIVISTQSSELLKTKEDLARTLEQSNIYKDKWEKSDALREKWLRAYDQVNDLYDACKKDRTTFQKQLTECQNKKDLTWGELIIKIWEKIKGVRV